MNLPAPLAAEMGATITRREILAALRKSAYPMTVKRIGFFTIVGVSAIRAHLQVLISDGMVEEAGVAHSRGNPMRYRAINPTSKETQT